MNSLAKSRRDIVNYRSLLGIEHYLVDPGETVETAEDLEDFEESMEMTEVAVISEAQADCLSSLCSTSLPSGGDSKHASNSATQLSNPWDPNQDNSW